MFWLVPRIRGGEQWTVPGSCISLLRVIPTCLSKVDVEIGEWDRCKTKCFLPNIDATKLNLVLGIGTVAESGLYGTPSLTYVNW